MPRLDLPVDELRTFAPTVAEPDDFDTFWEGTLREARTTAGPMTLTRVDSPLTSVEVYDASFAGFGGDPVRGWFITPAGATGPLPTIVQYVGYGGGRSLPHEHLAWAASGFAFFVMDTRGQGVGWGSGGATADPHGAGPAIPGYLTRGIDDPAHYYYRRVYTDAVLAIDAVAALDIVDATRVTITGVSQGGGITIAAAGLSGIPALALPDVPFLCHFERAVGFTDREPYNEIVRYLRVQRDAVEQTFRTLSYFDGVNFAKRAQIPTLFSVALMDPICPPSTVFAAYNRWAGPRAIVEYAFNEHEGGNQAHWPRQVAFVQEQLGA